MTWRTMSKSVNLKPQQSLRYEFCFRCESQRIFSILFFYDAGVG